MIETEIYKKVDIVDSDCKVLISSVNINVEKDRIILHGDGFPLLAHNTPAKAVGYMKNGVVAMEGIVSLSIDSQLNLDVIRRSGKTDRRNYLKVKTDAEANVIATFTSGGKGLLVGESVRLRDISVGGMCFFSNRVYFVKQGLYVKLAEIRNGLIVKAVVLRKNKERPLGSYRYRYACKFIELNNQGQRLICEYVFKMELENYRREKEKDLNIYD